MLQILLGLVNPLKAIGDQLNRAYEAKLLAMNDKERIMAEKQISALESSRDVLIAEQGSWMTRWIRPAMAAPVVVFWWKLIVWDTVLGWGTTPDPGEFVMWFCIAIPNVYFLMRPIERRRR
jgi:hypothetical protein